MDRSNTSRYLSGASRTKSERTPKTSQSDQPAGADI